MPQTILTDSESAALARAVRHLVVRARTGEVGVLHGAERFVSTQDCFKKEDRKSLEAALVKLGVSLRTV